MSTRFCPTDLAWQLRQCNALDLELSAVVPMQSAVIGPPTLLHRVKGDGNCFFRCIAHLITGNENDHIHVRTFVTNKMRHMINLQTILPNSYDVQTYLRRSKMYQPGTWATHVEIFATANVLNTTIYLYTRHGNRWKWLKHVPTFVGLVSQQEPRATYINHTNMDHFDVVLSVNNIITPSLSRNLLNTKVLQELQRQHKQSRKIADAITDPAVVELSKERTLASKRCEVKVKEVKDNKKTATKQKIKHAEVKLGRKTKNITKENETMKTKREEAMERRKESKRKYKEVKRQDPHYKKQENLKRKESRRRKANVIRSEASPSKKVKKANKVPVNESVIQHFKHCTQESPEYICSICNRLLYKTTVRKLHSAKIPHPDLLDQCRTYNKSRDGEEYICKTCHRYLCKNELPPQAISNKLDIPPCPEELAKLNIIEARLLSQRYPFMKLIALPKGRQSCIQGSVVNVPVDAEQVCRSLPRTPLNAGVIPVKVKRKQQYKSHVYYKNIRPDLVKQAFVWLKENNKHYSTVVERVDWEKECEKEDDEAWRRLTGTSEPESEEADVTSNEDAHQEIDDSSGDSKLRGLQYDTCIQKTDPLLDAENILSISPGEGKIPINIMTDKDCEQQAFPQLFPTGEFGFQAERVVPLTPKKYFNARILHKDGRFASNIEYIFFAQYISEYKQIMDSLSIAFRKMHCKSEYEESLTVGMIRDPSRLQNLIFNDKAYRFLKTIRGTPPYWQNAMYKLLAAVKQFGIFTFFVTLSAADLRWSDTLQVILKQQGKTLSSTDISNLTWEQKCDILRSNPVTAARHFDHRLSAFFREVVLGNAKPLGEVLYYSYRIEFQQRGSPHAHCVIWTKDAPSSDADDETIVSFIDKYITCEIPSKESQPELHTLVTTLQRHSHSASCKKKQTNCRFHYPRPPSTVTLIAKPCDNDNMELCKCKLEYSAEIKQRVSEKLDGDGDYETVEDLLKSSGVSAAEYTAALKLSKRGKTVILKRKPSEKFTNSYNPLLLKAWEANIDVQYCLDPYACIAYMVSYITKDEREISQLLQSVSKENISDGIRSQMKKCGTSFLNAREVSAQEAVYRLLSMPLFRSNYQTIFVPADLPEKRVSFVKPGPVIRNMDENDEDIFCTNILDRYAARPDDFLDFTLAEFAVWYTPCIAKKDPEEEFGEDCENVSTTVITLKNSLGKMRKRQKAAVLRYYKVSSEKESERFAYSQLVLFKPWRNENLDILKDFSTYSEHYENVYDIISSNKSMFEYHTKEIEDSLDQLQKFGPPEHSWDNVSAQTQQDLSDQIFEKNNIAEFQYEQETNEETNEETDVFKGFETVNSTPVTLSIETRPSFVSDDMYRTKIQQLNEVQTKVFQHILQWCSQFSDKNNTPDQLKLFVSGGAGTGKSHLIECIYQMAMRRFQTHSENPDEIHIVLAAPTGTAAHNISGVTLHSAFLLPLGQAKSYIKLSDDKRNSLRSKIANLKLLIIDEISMVGVDLLLQLHYRLCEITGISDTFGGVSILAFGDLFQLPPVLQQYVFKTPRDPILALYGSLWTDFKFIELTEVMRQKDGQFAALLNRIRTASHSIADVGVLQSRCTTESASDYPKDALHVFATNQKVDDHNTKRLNNLNADIKQFQAIDKVPKVLKNYSPSNDIRFTGGLPNSIVVSLGARVMLIRNLDVSDGLVNGAQGKVVGFINEKTESKTIAILVKFDTVQTGSGLRKKSQFSSKLHGATPILRSEISYTVSAKSKSLAVTRQQFPIKLCWACTIHKVQGITVDKIVVSFANRFNHGQAYVALSRVRTLSGLYLLDLDQKKITANISVLDEIERMKTNCTLDLNFSPISEMTTYLRLALLNVRSLVKHDKDVALSWIIQKSDIVILTETWLSSSVMNASLLCEQMFSIFRSDKKNINNNSSRTAGGVAILIRKHIACESLYSYAGSTLQVIVVKCTHNMHCYCIVGIYRSPEKSVSQIDIRILQDVLNQIDQVLIAGDLNDGDATSEQMLTSLFEQNEYHENVHVPTHLSGSRLDHVLTKTLHVPELHVAESYFSDHKWVYFTLA